MRRVAVHEDGTLGRGPARRDRVTVHLAGDGVAVSAGDRAPAVRGEDRHDGDLAPHRDEVIRDRVDVVDHREDVVRRLLGRGLSPRLLRELVPEFDAVIDRVERA
jgi:hypothetical protein